MEIVMKPIEMITRHSIDGVIRPERYRISEGEETIVVHIDKILAEARQDPKAAGN